MGPFSPKSFSLHLPAPLLKMGQPRRNLILSTESVVGQDSEQIEIDKSGTIIQQKRPLRQHLVKGGQQPFQLLSQGGLLIPPMGDTAWAEFSFFMAEEHGAVIDRAGRIRSRCRLT